jgi:pimeloyl-ACP methyl ester carboxylesterase
LPFADVSGLRLFYTDEGSGEPAMLLVHGWSCDSHDWSWQIPAFAKDHRVIASDLRGHGRSSVSADGYTPRSFAADLAQLLSGCSAGPVVAIGHSLGAVIVSVLAVEHPELIRAVVVVDSAYGIGAERKSSVAQLLQELRGPAGIEVAAGLGARTAATPPGLETWHRRRVLGTPPDVMADTLAGIYQTDDQIGFQPESDQYLRRRACPVLGIYADQSRAIWEATTHEHPYSRQVAWEGSGHWLHQERSAEFNSLVLDWIGGLPSH